MNGVFDGGFIGKRHIKSLSLIREIEGYFGVLIFSLPIGFYFGIRHPRPTNHLTINILQHKFIPHNLINIHIISTID